MLDPRTKSQWHDDLTWVLDKTFTSVRPTGFILLLQPEIITCPSVVVKEGSQK